MFDLVTVGHFAIDLIISPKIASPQPTLGGPPTYTSVAAAKLGAKVSVISKVGEDFPNKYLKWLKANGIDLSGLKQVKSAATTKFILTYRNGERKLQLKNCAPPISTQDIPYSLQTKALHVAPIANEIQNGVIVKLRGLTEILSLDPQGFVRTFDKKRNMRLKPWKAKQALTQIDVYKSSSREIRTVTQLRELPLAMREIQEYGAKIVMVTRGVKGTVLLVDDEFYHIPTCKPRVFRDPTGAGDAFIGAFLAEYLQGKEVLWCACVGSAASSFVVEGIGPEVFGEKEETYMRAKEIYEKGLKQLSIYVRFGGLNLGRVAKGVNCTVTGCDKDAVRSLPADKVTAAGLKVGETRRAYLCKEHYKEFKKETKKERKLEKWRHGTP